MLSLQSKVKLANGVEIPRLGLGVYQSPPGRTTQNVVKYALSIGYRHARTITGLEVLARIIDPEGFEDIKVPTDSFAKYEY